MPKTFSPFPSLRGLVEDFYHPQKNHVDIGSSNPLKERIEREFAKESHMILPRITNKLTYRLIARVIDCLRLAGHQHLHTSQATLTRGPLETHYAVSKSNFPLMIDPLCVLLLFQIVVQICPHGQYWVDAVHNLRNPSSGFRGRSASLAVQRKEQ